MENNFTSNIAKALTDLVAEASRYFEEAREVLHSSNVKPYYSFSYENDVQDYYWNEIGEALQLEARKLARRLMTLAGELGVVLKSSVLISDSDHRDLVVCTKTMRSALMLREYTYTDTEILHNEGEFLGIQQAQQSDNYPEKPSDAKQKFIKRAEQLTEMIQLVEAGSTFSKPLPEEISLTHSITSSASRYRQGTAFIIMSMDKEKPELDDIRDVVKDVFKSFNIDAVRADDIEHEGVITERVVREIATSEFLFADLTGERPNVYYEVGYAHALGKRVILYRKKDTGVHFDLALYNCPEYRNLNDLKAQLTKRLTAITNKKLESLDD